MKLAIELDGPISLATGVVMWFRLANWTPLFPRYNVVIGMVL